MAVKRLSLHFESGRRTVTSGLLAKIDRQSRSHIRNFHATSRRPFVNDCLTHSHTLICGLHDITGLPWAATIPLTALLTRALILFPFEYYSRKITFQRINLVPSLVDATITAQQTLAQEHPGKSLMEKNKIVAADVERTYQRLVKKYGLQGWKAYLRFIRWPVWLVVMETLNVMAGAEVGLLGWYNKSQLGASAIAAIPVEDSFLAEGMLWFPNLQLPDPSLILPFMLCATLLTSASIFPVGVQKQSTAPPTEAGVVFRVESRFYDSGMSKIHKILALVAAPATLQLPSALTLYWICSGLCSMGSKALLIKLMPIKRENSPAKRRPASEKQQFRGPTMHDLRDADKKQKKKQKK